MAYSYVLYAGDGSNKYFSFNFSYLDKSHVKAKIDNTPTTAFTWLTNNSIQFTTAPAAGVVLEIYRETPQNSAPVDFTDGSILLERDLDLLATFNLYVGQEATDRAARTIAVGSDGAFNALGLRVSNAADPVNDQDLVTKSWAEKTTNTNIGLAVQSAAQAAASAQDSAQAAADARADLVTISQYAADAANSKDVAATNHRNAEAAKDQAVYARNDAQTAATSAANSATSANAARDTAEAARDTAVSAKDTAVSAKDTAVSASNTAVSKATEASNSAASVLDSKNTAVSSATAASSSANLAQNWASSMGLVDGVSFGAKKYASDAAASATQAGNSASAAASSANSIGNAETNAVTKAREAAASALAASNSLKDFEGQWFGPLTDDPTVDSNGNPVEAGDLYFNTTMKSLKVFNGVAWRPIGGAGVTGAGGDSCFFENDTLVRNSYTITNGKNAMSAGPITINNGVTVTVPNGSVWTVV